MKARQIPTEAERLEKYFRQLAHQIPNPTPKEMEQVLSRPCKWAKILEERKNNPDGSGGQ
jgi:hypothetical protein